MIGSHQFMSSTVSKICFISNYINMTQVLFSIERSKDKT